MFNTPEDFFTIDDESTNSDRITALATLQRYIDTAPPVSKYNGKPGCACGCNGTYVEDPNPATVKRTTKIIMRHIIDNTGEVMFGDSAGKPFVWAETETTANALYWY